MKKQKILKYLIFWFVLGLIVSLSSHIIIELLYYDYNFSHVAEQNFIVRPVLFLFGTTILFLLYILLTSLVGSAVIGGILLFLFSWLTGIATNLKGVHRAEPLYPNEMYWLKELPFLFDMIGIGNTVLIIIVLLITSSLLFVLYKYQIKPRKDPTLRIEKNTSRIIGIITTLSLLFYISQFNYSGNKVKNIYDEYASWVSFSQPQNYNKNGFIAGFLFNLDAPPMEIPDNYSKESIESLFDKYKNKSIEINQNKNNPKLDTNIIYVMNESFSDPFNLEGIKSDRDPIPNFREITNHTLNGTLLVPGFGGGTATNEFQVLTGISLEPLSPHITSPFVQMTNRMKELPSMVGKMKGYDYNATAIHAFTPTYYRRRDVYEYLRFDEFIHEDTMQYTDTVTEIHQYISDESIYREMFDVLKNTAGPNFIHLVTMQNHAGYRNKYESTNFDVSGSGDYGSANGYFQDLENSDKALLNLIDKVNQYPEPILLLFWGDHLPGFYEGEITKLNSEITLRETPFFIYSNDLELQGDTGMRSLIYLNNYIVKTLELEVSPFEALMFSLEEKLPIVDKRMYYENHNSKEVISREELSEHALEILKDYTLLMYDVTTGKNYAKDIGFFEYFN